MSAAFGTPSSPLKIWSPTRYSVSKASFCGGRGRVRHPHAKCLIYFIQQISHIDLTVVMSAILSSLMYRIVSESRSNFKLQRSIHLDKFRYGINPKPWYDNIPKITKCIRYSVFSYYIRDKTFPSIREQPRIVLLWSL